jgi:MFS family permease
MIAVRGGMVHASLLGVFMLLYGAFGVASPFLPALIEARGIPPAQIGLLFAAGTAIRVVSAPIAAGFADRTQALYGTVGVGAATVLLMLASGWLYAASLRNAEEPAR